MINAISWISAFLHGILAFFSPCVLPLLPLYFSYLAGSAIDEIQMSTHKKRLIVNTFMFLLGLSLLNILLGFGANSIQIFLLTMGQWFRYLGGGVMIVFGLFYIGIIKLNILNREKRFNVNWMNPNIVTSFIMGITFSLGWTPCNGPIVANILMLASFQKDYLHAGMLMSVYSLGFAIPFLVSALLMSQFLRIYKRIYKYFHVIKVIAGSMMIIMGVLLILNKVSWLNI